MGMMRHVLVVVAAGLCSPVWAQTPPDEDIAARNLRWQDLQRAIFPNRTIENGEGIIQLEAPTRALDAALVPLTITTSGKQPIKTVHLIIDNNPGPLAGRFTFGKTADASLLKVRMRVNTYTNIHAVAEATDGKLYSVEKFVKAAGGCSAPAGSNDPKALQDLGQMRVKLPNEITAGEPLQAQLMIRHPNFNGMQMDQITRHYTPAHFIKTIEISFEGDDVLRIESDIALSTDPVITFGFVPKQKGQLKVSVNDSKGQRFERAFDVVPKQMMTSAER
jgi:sulfur-oxidizing protein SoxY